MRKLIQLNCLSYDQQLKLVDSLLHLLLFCSYLQCVVEMIVAAKQCLLITAADAKQVLLFDAKTGCVQKKYNSESMIASTAAFYEHGQQFLIPHLSNTYLNIWEMDTQEARKFSIGDGQKITSLSTFQENILLMGSANGWLHLFQLPSGILLRKAPLHSSPIIKTTALPSGYIITGSVNEIKLWALKDILTEKHKPIAEKSIHSVPTIISYEIVCNIICILSQNSMRMFYADNFSPFQARRELPQLKNASCMCSSETSIYVGDDHGKIKQVQVDDNEKGLYYEDRLGVSIKSKRNNQVEIDARDPVTSLAHVNSLRLLVSGNCKGEVKIWSGSTLKNSLQLFKSSISQLFIVPCPQQASKIPQVAKIKAIHKQQMAKTEQPILVYAEPDSKVQPQPCSDHYLTRILELLSDPTELLSTELSLVKSENQKLIAANLHYCAVLNESD